VRLERIEMKNYKRLSDLDIAVRGHLVLIGANDVGKTSLLRALNLTLGPTAQLYQLLGPGDLRDLDHSLVVKVVFIDFTDAERSLFHREIDIDPIDRKETLEIRLEVQVDPDDAESVLISRWCPGRGEIRTLTREQVASFGWRYLPALRQSSPAQLDGASGAIQTLLRAVEPELGEEKTALSGLLESFNDRLESNQALTGMRKDMATHLSSSMPRSITADHLAVRTAADPSISVLQNVSMYLSRDGSFVPLSEQSDGIRQLISMTLFDLAEGAANVIAIDEPELHLHPLSQRTVAELLSKDANQKILVTHSPYIVHKFDPTQVVTVRADGGCNQIDPDHVSVEERVQAHWWSPRMLEALTAQFAIVVEGVADRLVVEAAASALGISLDRIGAVVFELGGAENFPAVYKLLGPKGFNVEVLGLVDAAEKGPWIGAVGGKLRSIIGRTVFVSDNDLEDEYCRALGVAAIVKRLVAAGVARDERAILASCKAANIDDLTPEDVAAFCRSSSGSGGGSRKVPAALAVSKSLTKEESEKITSVHDLLSELMRRAEV
jgi:putative ATP-dependent endonuclease of OLD family